MAPTETIRRTAWDTSSDRRRFSRPLQPPRVRGLVLHYPGDGARSRAGLSAAGVGALLRGYQRYHRTARGWPDLGYLAAIDQAGRLYEGAGFVVGAHSAVPDTYPAGNHERVGVVLVLGNDEAPSPAMLGTVGWLRGALPAGATGLPGWLALPGCHDLDGHRDMPGASTRCPGDRATALIRAGGFGAYGPTLPARPTTTTPAVMLPATLRRTRAQTLQAQNILTAAGFYPRGAVDGRYGPLTAQAARDYQAGQLWPRLPADGDFGPRTLAHALWTRQLQTALNRWRTALPELRLDFDYGDLTLERVAEWQRRNRAGAYPARAAVDGQAGRLTVAGLELAEHP